MATGLARKVWTVEEYEKIIEKGVLTEDDRVELIKGEIVEMAPIGMRHAGCVMILESLFHELLGVHTTISVQNPILLPGNSEPQPDLAILKGPARTYARRRPTVNDVVLLVEVADTTLATDRGVKIPLYAGAGISEVWLVNLEQDVIEVYARPVGGDYEDVRVARKGDEVALPGDLVGSVKVVEVLG